MIEEDFIPDSSEASMSAVINTIPPASVLTIINIELGTGRIFGSHWQVAGDIKQPIKYKASRLFVNVEDQSVTF